MTGPGPSALSQSLRVLGSPDFVTIGELHLKRSLLARTRFLAARIDTRNVVGDVAAAQLAKKAGLHSLPLWCNCHLWIWG